MKRYPKYKDSGVKWIGEIPQHWEVSSFGRHFSFRKGLPITKADLLPEGVAVISYGQIHAKFNRKTTLDESLVRYVSPSFLETNPQCLLKKGDFVFADTSEDIEGSGNCCYNDYPNDIFAGYHTVVASPNDLLFPKYYAYLFSSTNWRRQVQTLVNGVKVFSISRGILKQSMIIHPSLDEQQAIVAYLDEKVGKIDRYISEKEKEIVALDELKQATIANAVTRGLDPNAPLKDSGIKWIGNIPQHWEVKRAKNMFVKMQRPVRPEDEVVTCFRDGQVTLRKNRRTEGFTESLKEIGYQGVRKGDLVIHQMDAFAGSIGVSDSDGKGTPVYHCCMPKGDYNNYYYCFVLREMARSGFIKSLYRGIRERSSDFRFDTFAAQWLPIPPRQEQDSIVNFVNERCDKINRMKDGIKSEIEKLKEYKQRLISDVVTGKVCVKGEK